MDHIKRLLEEACLNHAYPIRHKLMDYGMMRSIMTSGSLTWGAELDEGPNGSDMISFPEENANMTVYGGHPPGPQLTVVGDTRGQGCNGTSFPSSK
jgi:hypothetical protein